MKPFQTSDWYQTFVGYGAKVTDQYKYVEQFQKYNLASMYKLVPSNLSGEESSEYLKNSEFFLEDPARTLNSIVPRIFKYLSMFLTLLQLLHFQLHYMVNLLEMSLLSILIQSRMACQSFQMF
jgi:hypothetical protein